MYMYKMLFRVVPYYSTYDVSESYYACESLSELEEIIRDNYKIIEYIGNVRICHGTKDK